MKRQRLPPAANCSVFFRGVPLFVTQKELRPHFESVGRVLEFRLMGPSPGKDFRYGEVDYADEKTAQEAILRLHGHTFGDRSMRVALLDSRFRKRGRKDASGPHSFSSSGRGGGWGSSSAGVGTTPAVPLTDDRGRPLMQFSRGFFDPVLGREDSMVLEVLKRTATEDAYEAVEQLRVLVIERPEDAQRLLQENPALISAVIMVLQHARRIPFGALPPEAFGTTSAGIKNTAIDEANRLSTATGGKISAADCSQTVRSGRDAYLYKGMEGMNEENSTVSKGRQDEKAVISSSKSFEEKEIRLEKEGETTPELGEPNSGANTISLSSSFASSTEKNASELTIKITDAQRQQALQSIKKMRDEDVEKILVLTPKDLEKVQNVQQRKQLQVLQQCLHEMSRDL